MSEVVVFMYAAACKARFDFSSGSHTKFTFSDFGSNLSNFTSLVLSCRYVS